MKARTQSLDFFFTPGAGNSISAAAAPTTPFCANMQPLYSTAWVCASTKIPSCFSS